MKLDRELLSFTEKYDKGFMEAVDDLANDFGVGVRKLGFTGFNLVESFDTFSQYLEGYADYKTKHIGNEKATPQDQIRESVALFIKDHIFKEAPVAYTEIPGMLKGYMEGCNKLIATVESVKSRMMESGVDQSDIGDVNTFADQFIDRFHESFDPMMDNLMWASGYRNRRDLINRSTRKTSNTPAPVFL